MFEVFWNTDNKLGNVVGEVIKKDRNCAYNNSNMHIIVSNIYKKVHLLRHFNIIKKINLSINVHNNDPKSTIKIH